MLRLIDADRRTAWKLQGCEAALALFEDATADAPAFRHLSDEVGHIIDHEMEFLGVALLTRVNCQL